MDRFNTNEDAQEWDSTAWRDGHCARMAEKPMTCPAKYTGWLKKSWNAGWADADASIQADRLTDNYVPYGPK